MAERRLLLYLEASFLSMAGSVVLHRLSRDSLWAIYWIAREEEAFPVLAKDGGASDGGAEPALTYNTRGEAVLE